MGKINYKINNFYAECRIKYTKDVLFCKEIGCHKRLRTNGTGYARRIEVPRVK